MNRGAVPSVVCAVLLAVPGASLRAGPPLADAIAELKAVGPEGSGNAAAREAWRKAVQPGMAAVPDLLRAMSGANDYALAWLRTAVEAAVQRGLAAGTDWPKDRLLEILKDTANHPRARGLAFELFRRADPTAAGALLDSFLEDPAPDLRREAVQGRILQAESRAAVDKAAAVEGLRSALAHAREADQIEALAKRLKDLGAPADLRAAFGWISRWKVVGPFDNAGGVGFTRAEAPESGFDPAAEFDGKKGRVRWLDYEAKGDYGIVDFNSALGAVKGAAGYALAEFHVKSETPAQIRLGSELGWKVWVNGQFLFGRDEYHRGAEIDQYRLPVVLKPGRNLILVKCLQNEQTEDWAVDWQYQLRVTDPQGRPILSQP